jgi:hypothetical protein
MQITPHVVSAQVDGTGFIYIWLLLRAFAGGCTALTGIEAISDGVPAFKAPESKNAATTMVAMGIIAMSLFIGITFLATHLQLVPEETDSILSQLTRRATGTGFIYYWVQFFTAGILFLAANTGFQDFPRLSFFLARDNFLPRWLQIRGDRLVYSAGIMTLTLLSGLLIIAFQANEIAMLPLYALGVMLGFSLSQTGMFRLMGKIKHLKPGEILHTLVTEVHFERHTGWKQAINALGAILTFTVFLILLITKFVDGAWIVAVLIPLLVSLFYSINRHYELVSNALSTQGLTSKQIGGVAEVVIVPIADVHRGSLLALQYAKKISSDVRAITIFTSDDSKERFMDKWNRFGDITRNIKLLSIEYDYRDILSPIVEYIKNINSNEFENQLTTVVVPEFIPESKFASSLHNQTAARLRARLRDDKDIVIIEVPFHVDYISDKNINVSEPEEQTEPAKKRYVHESFSQVVEDEPVFESEDENENGKTLS